MDAVLADEQRDGEAIPLREVHRAVDLRPEDVQERPRLARVDEGEVVAAGVEHQQLTDLLLEGHAADEVGDSLVDGQRGVAVRGRGGVGGDDGCRGHEGEGGGSEGERGEATNGTESWHWDLAVKRGHASGRSYRRWIERGPRA